MKRSVFGFLVTVFVTALLVPSLRAEPTRIDVRVISKGAKFVGSSMGGVEITIHDADTGELLDRGKTAGSTGDTARIMKVEAPHHAPVSTPDAAVFRGEIDLEEPRRVRVTGRGPLGQPQAVNVVTATQWIVPGKHVTGGDAFLLELPGFVVDVLDPPAHVKVSGVPATVTVRANVTMMCGCPVTPGGLWDAEGYEIVARVRRTGAEEASEVPLVYAGSPSQFRAEIELSAVGAYEILVYAHDPENGNTGLDRTTLILSE